jgi:hypothetical protein
VAHPCKLRCSALSSCRTRVLASYAFLHARRAGTTLSSTRPHGPNAEGNASADADEDADADAGAEDEENADEDAGADAGAEDEETLMKTPK